MKRLSLVGTVAVAAIAAGAWWANSGPVSTTDLPYGAVNAQENDSAAEVDTSSIVEMTLGAEDAPVTIVEYASFTCPHCASFHKESFKQLKSDFIDTGKVKFTYRDVYFDRFGLWAAMVARCGGQERFFGISDMLYNQQKDWIAGGNDPVEIANNLRRIGKVAGLDEEQLEICLNDNAKAKTLVAWYQENAQADDVSGTPTFIIDGKKHSNMSYSDLKELIEGKLDS
jgi:protein-disulfide isomerase